jgi:hypothetical protein
MLPVPRIPLKSRAAGGINRAWGSRCVLCVLATWREKKGDFYDRECHCQGDCRRGFPRSYDSGTGLITFRVARIKDGITRIVSGLEEEDDHAKSPSRKEA